MLGARTLDFPCSGLLIQTFGITLFDDAERSIDKYFNEWNGGFLVCFTSNSTVPLIRRDEGGDGNRRGVGEEFGNLNIWSANCDGRCVCGKGRTSPIRLMFSLRDFSSNPRSLFKPNLILSPSKRYVNLWRWSRCCSSAQAIVD